MPELIALEGAPLSLVSVVVPAYNHARFVEEALQSVIRQTHGEIELIVIDDGSTDATYDVCNATLQRPGVAARFRRLELVRNAGNAGAHAALNRGLHWAAGHFVTFLNSDDSFASDRIATLVQASQRADAAFVFSALHPIDEAGRTLVRNGLVQALVDRPRVAALTYPSMSFGFMAAQLTGTTGNMLLRRDLVAATGAFRDLRYCHDWDYAMRCILRAEPLFVDRPLYNYRIHAANSFAALDGVAVAETRQVLTGYFAHCERAACRNPLAPSAANWPGLFEAAARRFGVFEHYARARGAQGPSVRTLDHAERMAGTVS